MSRTSKTRLKRLIEKENKTKFDKDVIRYASNLFRATPAWLNQEQRTEINRIYKRAKQLGQTVDHIVPLASGIVCGLHVPWNLQILTREENNNKGNRYWPDCPYEQVSLPLYAEIPPGQVATPD